MIHKIRGIVLKTTSFSESSVISQIFTDKFGLQSYMIQGVKKPKAKIGMNMLQPLHLLDIVTNHKQNSTIQRINEAKPAPAFTSIPYEITKSTMAVFLNEVLYKSIRQQSADDRLFDFLYHSICWLDQAEPISNNFHLAFLLKLSRYLGFAPNTQARKDQPYFDLQEGEFTSLRPGHPHYISYASARYFIDLYQLPFERLQEIQLKSLERRALLENILIYYKLHTASFGEVQSHVILEEVMG